MVLLVFLASHFINHAFGIISLETMEAGRAGFSAVWRSLPGTVLLYGAILVHFLSALDALYRRRTLKLPPAELLKIGFGLSLPFLIASHVVGTRLDYALSGYDRGYPEVIRILWSTPLSRIQYIAVLFVAWAHGCLGLWFWLRSRAWFQRWAALFHMVAVIVPLLACMGFYVATKAAYDWPRTPADVPRTDAAVLYEIVYWIYGVFGTLLAGLLAAKLIPDRNRIEIRYFGGKTVLIQPGLSVLEASRSAGIPHVSVCGGRGRCSTCRVQILQGADRLPEVEDLERQTLKRIAAPDDVRLACQLRPNHNLTVLPLVEAGAPTLANQPAQDRAAGRERLVATLFCDIRSFTQLSESKLPYDIVFLLNRYFGMVNEAVEANGGVVDKYIGDGVIALFGIDTPFDLACRQSLACAARLSSALETLNRSFSAELDAPLRVAMGLHAGPAIVGRMGHGPAATLTAIGDTVNIASRLEGLAKEHNVELAVSAELVNHGDVTFPDHESREVSIRGRAAPLETWLVLKAAEIDKCVAEATERHQTRRKAS